MREPLKISEFQHKFRTHSGRLSAVEGLFMEVIGWLGLLLGLYYWFVILEFDSPLFAGFSSLEPLHQQQFISLAILYFVGFACLVRKFVWGIAIWLAISVIHVLGVLAGFEHLPIDNVLAGFSVFTSVILLWLNIMAGLEQKRFSA